MCDEPREAHRPCDRGRVPTRTVSAVLTAEGVEKSYRRGIWLLRRQQQVLRGADLYLNGAEVVGLVGENGSGKSTLMKILVGALAADEGTVTREGRLGYCPQEPQVAGRLTCDEHFELFGHAYRMTACGRAGFVPASTPRWASDATRPRADQLSGGTLAKLNLGLALLADPDLLLLDAVRRLRLGHLPEVLDLVATRRAAGRSVLIISHFVVDEDRFDRIVEIRDGRTVPR